jgi:hypothetical protein
MKKTLLILLVTVLAMGVLHAQKPEVVTNNKAGWHKIGDANVNFKTDKDQFLILGKDRFKAIQLKVDDAPVRIEDMQVFYEGGAKEDVSLRNDFKPGSESRVIDLKNGSAELKKVVFVYKTVANTAADKAHIELWGLK